MMRRWVIGGICMLLVLTGCGAKNMSGSDVPGPVPGDVSANSTATYNIEDLDSRVVQASNRFGLRLYEEIAKKKGKENIFISPASISLALAMTYNGADGETKKAMEEAMQLQGLSLQEVNEGNRMLIDLLVHADPRVQLSIANSIWAKEGYHFLESFLEANKTYYGAEVESLDFDDPAAVKTINGWVKKSTNGSIDKIIQEISPDTVMYLINAIYFKGGWTDPFNEKATKDGNFYTLSGGKSKVPMMERGGRYEYKKADGYAAIRIPYGDGKLRMAVYVPEKIDGLSGMVSRLLGDSAEMSEGFDPGAQGTLRMPRFKLEYELELSDALKAIGMGLAFDRDAADFSGMAPVPPTIYISKVLHKTYLDVNEKGTEAAAVTAVETQVTSAPAEFFEMNVDRPFFFTIEDSSTGASLFFGSVSEL